MSNLAKPCLIIHGSADPAVPQSAAEELQSFNPAAQIHIIAEADHVFGGRHPYSEADLPPHSAELADVSINFFQNNL